MSTRTFTVAPGRSLTLPKSLLAGRGATHARFAGGQSFELPAEKAADRFIRGRLRAGDLIEATAPADVVAPAEPAPTRVRRADGFDLAAGTRKEK